MANIENIQKWVDALRNGQYRQSSHFLRTDKGYCCLGVACDLAAKDGVHLHISETNMIWSYEGRTGSLPENVQSWLDIDEGDPDLDKGGETFTCSELNDTEQASFPEIASWIEATYLGV